MLRTLVRAMGALGLAATLAASASAQIPVATPIAPPTQRDALHAPGSDVSVWLLTMGDADNVESMFGHTAIWVRDTVTQRDTVINWGVFDMTKPNFILHFLQGLNWYSVGGDSMGYVMRAYRYWNRSVTGQELDLTTAQKDSLLRIMQVNLQPQNVNYRYDYFIDNCATRPRDILNQVLGGQLRTGADSLSGTSYRWHALRLMQSNVPLATGVDVALGEPSDRPITKWEEMFLPAKLHDWVATRQVKDSAGAMHPLVKQQRVLFQSTRPPEPTAPPKFAWLYAAGVVIALLFVWLGLATRTGAAIAFGVWSALCGILGVLLTLLWTITDHRFAYANENLLLFNPLWLVLAVLLPLWAMRDRTPRFTKELLYTVSVLSVIALVAHVALSRQNNLPVIGLALPPALALAFVVAKRGPMSRL